MHKQKPYLDNFPNENGYFGKFGGAYIPPELQKPFKEIEEAYQKLSKDFEFLSELKKIRKYYQGRPTPVYFAKNLSNIVRWKYILKKRRFKSYRFT